mgnify:CR=1 FL=1
MKRIGIYGGTFNPPHIGHIKAAESMSRIIQPDTFLIIPDFLPPHKSFDGMVSADDRLNMCKLAFSHVNNVHVSDIEIKRGGKSYTSCTLEELSADDRELYFLCGSDMFLTLSDRGIEYDDILYINNSAVGILVFDDYYFLINTRTDIGIEIIYDIVDILIRE